MRRNAFGAARAKQILKARAVADETLERYRRLDERIEKSPLDPEVPYFLDEDPSKLTITGPRRGGES